MVNRKPGILRIHPTIIIVPLLMFAFYIIGCFIFDPWFDATMHVIRKISGTRFIFVAKPFAADFGYKKFSWFFSIFPIVTWLIHMYTNNKQIEKWWRTVLLFGLFFLLTWFIFCCFQYSNVFALKGFFVNGEDLSARARLVNFMVIYWVCFGTATIATIFTNLVLQKISVQNNRSRS